MHISDWSSNVCSSYLWQPVNQKEEDMAPDAHNPGRKVPTMMTTADMALKVDTEFRVISEKFRKDHEAFKDDLASAWFKLYPREIGRASCRERVCQYVKVSGVGVSLQKKI